MLGKNCIYVKIAVLYLEKIHLDEIFSALEAAEEFSFTYRLRNNYK